MRLSARAAVVGAFLAFVGCEQRHDGLVRERSAALQQRALAAKLEASGKLHRAPRPIAGRYIVVLEDTPGASGEAARAKVQQAADALARAHGAQVRRVYAHALKGFAA